MSHRRVPRSTRRSLVLCTAALLSACLVGPGSGTVGAEVADPGPAETRFRQPVALAISRDGAWLFVANRRSGTLSVIDLKGGRVVSECDAGRGLAGIAVLADGLHLLAVDQ